MKKNKANRKKHQKLIREKKKFKEMWDEISPFIKKKNEKEYTTIGRWKSSSNSIALQD